MMITYHPAYDVYHCSYRILNVLHSIENHEVSKETLKFIDFYYVYPHLLKIIPSLPRPLNFHKAKIDRIEDPFEITPSPKGLYFELAQIQESAITSLGYKSLIIQEDRKVKLNSSQLPDQLVSKFKADEFNKSGIFDLLVNVLPKINLNGSNGLKAKSGLMEFRYG